MVTPPAGDAPMKMPGPTTEDKGPMPMPPKPPFTADVSIGPGNTSEQIGGYTGGEETTDDKEG